MDKTNTFIGIGLLLAGLGLMSYFTEEPQPQPQSEQPAQMQEGITPAPVTPTEAGQSPAPATLPQIASPQQVGPAAVESNGTKSDEVVVSLSNSLIEAHFTNYGGAIRDITLKDFEATKGSSDPYILNGLRYSPALSLTNLPGAGKDAVYEVDYGSDGNTINFTTVIPGNVELTRTYAISQDEKTPYLIRHETILRNLTETPLAVGELKLNIGTVAPTGGQDSFLLTFGYSDGEDVDFIERSKFESGGFLGFFGGGSNPPTQLDESSNIKWASVKNQFFITILTGDDYGTGYTARPVRFPGQTADDKPNIGITGDFNVGGVTIPANGTHTLGFNYYAGPKEHGRLAKLENGEEEAMQFGFFGFISKLLLQMMNGIHSMVGNYGVAIICVTLIIRTILLPINLISSRSMKRMSKLAEPMKLLKEKFPDNQQKQQQMMMELYKLNKVNPVAGCLPMLMQIPVFFALFYMLRNAAELRFAEFLWISDLSAQEGIFTLPFTIPFLGDQFNILPILMTVTMALQMQMTPTPSVDNAQAKMIKIMPYIFFPITYTFASGLVLYWTVSNIFTIVQTWQINRGAQDFEVIYPPALKKALDAPKKGKRAKKSR